jgi:uncharacterized Zn-finger protein
MNVSCDKTFRQLLFVIFVAKNLLTKSNSLITLTTIIRTNARHFHQMEIYTDMVPISAFKGTLKQFTNCNKAITTSSPVKRHVKTVHQHVKSFKCDQCPSTFSRKINLINHKVQQHQIHLVCEACYRKYVNRNSDLA